MADTNSNVQLNPTNSGSATGNAAADTVIGSGIAAGNDKALASNELGTANADQTQAISALQNIYNTIASMLPPSLQSEAAPLAKLAYTGEYNVDDITAAVQHVSALNGIQLDPSAMSAQVEALNQYQQIAQGSGFTPIERAGIAQSQNLIQTQNTGANASIIQQMQQAGGGSTVDSTAARIMSQQNANQNASLAGANIAAASQQRAISALSGVADTGKSIAGQEANLAVTKGNATNAINQFNTQLAQDAAKSNQSANNTAASQEQTLNTGLQEQNVQNQFQSQNQKINAENQDYQNELAKNNLLQNNATTQAGVDTQYGLNEQKAGITAQQAGTAAQSAGEGAAASGMYNSLFGNTNSGGGNGVTSLFSGGSGGSSTPPAGVTDLGDGGSDLGAGFKDGGEFEKDGSVKGPGGPREDKIDAKLSNGEFVINAESTAEFKPILTAINDGASHEEVASLLDRIVPPKKRRTSALEALTE